MPSETEIKNRHHAQELNANLLYADPIIPNPNPQQPLSSVLEDENAHWHFTEEGGTGAILVTTGVEDTGGTALKVEDPSGARQVQKCATMMDTFFQNAQGQAPFFAPRVTTVTTEELLQQPKLTQQLSQKLTDLRENGTPTIQKRAGQQIKRLNEVEQGNGSVVKMEFAAGKMINELPIGDRIALYKTDAFAQTLGRSMPSFVALGMNDHLGIDGTNFKNNPSNLMYDPQRGKLSAIDFSTNLAWNPENPEDQSKIRFAQGGGARGIQSLNNFLTDALKDQQSFDQAVDMMVSGQETPLSNMMESFTRANWSANMFPEGDAQIVAEQISLEDKRRFAANLLAGTVEGLEYVQQNEQALRQATLESHDNVNGTEIQHFYTPQQLDEFCDQMRQIDTPQLKQQMQQRLAGMEQARKQRVNQQLDALGSETKDLQAKLDSVNRRIQRREEHGRSLKDRFNDFTHGGKEANLQRLRDKKLELEGRLAEKRDAMNEIMSQESFHDELKRQARNPDEAKVRMQVNNGQNIALNQSQNVDVQVQNNNLGQSQNLNLNQSQNLDLEPPPNNDLDGEEANLDEPAIDQNNLDQDALEQQPNVNVNVNVGSPGKLKDNPAMRSIMERHGHSEGESQGSKVRKSTKVNPL